MDWTGWRRDGVARLAELGLAQGQAQAQAIGEAIGQADEQEGYGVRVIGLPAMSRVENQMKIVVEVEGGGSLLKLPRECVAKDRHLMETRPATADAQVLYMECYVLGVVAGGYKDVQVCDMCLNREYRRSLRRKSGVSDNAAWRAHPARKAVIFNEREFVEPRSGANRGTGSTKFELTTRIVCYCAHQAAELGFKLLFVVKDHRDAVVGAALAGPIMILDSKRINSLKQGTQFQLNPAHSVMTSGTANSGGNSGGCSGGNSGYSGADSAIAAGSDVSGSEYVVQKAKKMKSTSSHPRSMSHSIPHTMTHSHAMSHSMSHSMSQSHSLSHTDASSILTSLIPSDAYDSPASSVSSALPHFPVRNEPKPLNSITNMLFDASYTPEIKKIIPSKGPVQGGTEVTILGRNFRQGLNVRFGENLALVMTYWNETTIVATSPITTKPGRVQVTLEDEGGILVPSRFPVEFTYFDDSDRQLIELALQVIGLRMNGKIENAKSIAWKIVGNNNSVTLPSEL
ncbi:Protein SPT23 [Nakaseomyces bracarensis]|uniref:Protein SPT23 n=1 Tax=Nakaseomyces bracarensis TaxID=273131 RepID=A0ABR4NXH2_9SACH